jgi:hypothetical protein
MANRCICVDEQTGKISDTCKVPVKLLSYMRCAEVAQDGKDVCKYCEVSRLSLPSLTHMRRGLVIDHISLQGICSEFEYCVCMDKPGRNCSATCQKEKASSSEFCLACKVSLGPIILRSCTYCLTILDERNRANRISIHRLPNCRTITELPK